MKRANPITRGVLFLMGNERRQRITIPVFAILLSLIASSIVLLILGKDPIEAFISLLRGSGILPKEAYGAKKSMLTDFLSLLNAWTPMLFASLSVAVAMRAGLFNIGVSGQMLCAGFIATITVGYTETLPAVVAQLDDFLPRTLLMGGHLVCALSGALLLFVAYGLERRQNRAFWMAVILLLLGIAGALLKGLSFLAAGAALVVLITVWLSRRRFYRSSFFWEEAIPAHWLVLAFAALGLAMGLGWFIYHPAWDRATLWGFEQHFNASRVLLADVGIAVVVLVSWLVRVSLRARKRLQERNLQSGRVPRA